MSDVADLAPSLPPSLSISIVVYCPDSVWLTTTLQSLAAALVHAHNAGTMRFAKICMVDNEATSPLSPFSVELDKLCAGLDWTEAIVIGGQGNIGYGRANNLAIAHCKDYDFHLVLNPDVKLAEDAITNALRYLHQHAACAMVSPVATAPDGSPLYLVKRFPDFFTLALRGFAPEWIKQIFRSRLEAYECREVPFDADLNDVKITSGCFMLIRQSALARVGGFDPAFFLYFEDFDLSVRIANIAKTVRVANVRIVHAGGSAAAKSLMHRWLFIRSALRFHWKHR